MLPSSGPLSFSAMGSYLGTGTTSRDLYTMIRRASINNQTAPYSASTLYGYGPVTDGLVVYFDSDYAASYPGSGTTWTDSVAGITASMVNNPTYVAGTSGQTGVPSYFNFDNTVKYFIVNNDLYPEISSGDITANVWFYPTNLSIRSLIMSKWGSGGGNNTQFSIEFGTGTSLITNSVRVYEEVITRQLVQLI